MATRISSLLLGLFVTLGGLVPATAFGALVSSVLPTSRSAQVGDTVTAFATMINTGPGTATGCAISPVTAVPATFLYQTTDPATNALIGTPDTPVDIAENAAQSFVIAFTPSAPFAPTDVVLDFSCTNAAPVVSISGVNTLLLSASATPVPDVIALATGTGTVDIPAATGTAAFAVATVNVGTLGTITASADTGAVVLPQLSISICETDPATGVCISAVGPTVTTTIDAGATPTFALFLGSSGTIPFDPAVNRLRVLFTDAGQTVRGSTSVALMSDVVTIPDISGTYVGSGSITSTGCLDPADNLTIPLDADMSVSQSGENINGSVTASAQFPGVTVVVQATFTGTVDEQGNVSGTTTADLFVNGVFDSSSAGTITGSFSNGTLNIQIDTQDTVGDICSTTGSFTLTRQ